MAIQFKKVAIIGLGLIGASIAQAMLSRRITAPCGMVAFDVDKKSLEAALDANLISAGFTNLEQMIHAHKDMDLVVLAAPAGAICDIVTQLTMHKCGGWLQNAIITDVASTKQNVRRAVLDACALYKKAPDFLDFVPSHPIAGAEHSGVNARDGDLFVAHQFIVCADNPPTYTAKSLHKICTLWQALGAQVTILSSHRHDKVLAHTSHLPHLLAFNLVEQLYNHGDNMDIFRYAAGGFRDFTRIAASHPRMWHDIFLANKDEIIAAIEDYEYHLQTIKTAILQNQSSDILQKLLIASNCRRHFGHMLLQNHKEAVLSTQRYILRPANQFVGTHHVAPDKSISHRAIMLASLATGTSTITNFLQGEDALCTLNAFVDMGVNIIQKGDTVTINGVGLLGLRAAPKALDMGNSGTSMRLLAGILAAQDFDSVMIGDESLSKRPMERVAKPLRMMHASIQTTGEKGTAPLSIQGRKLAAIDYTLPVASAQIKSAILLAALFADGTTTVTEPEITRDHTERMLSAFGIDIQKQGTKISLKGGQQLIATDIATPNDISSAAFFMVGAIIAKHGDVCLKNVGLNPTRTGVIDILRLMGASIAIQNERTQGGEPIGDIYVTDCKLKGIVIPEHLVPLAIDEFPILFIAAACAQGQTILKGAAELRVKESDRILVMADGLKTLGIDCTVLEDGIIINGKGGNTSDDAPHIFSGGKILCHHDHRIAMSFAIASLRASDTIEIFGTQSVQTSFPDFASLAKKAGLLLEVVA